MRRLGLILATALALTACDDGDPPGVDGGPPTDAGSEDDAGTVPFRAECDNVDPTHCLTPWPSSFFLREDGETTTGYHMALPVEGMPINHRDTPVDPGQFERFDGFSPMTSMLASFPGPVDPATLNGETAIEATLSADSTTVLVDAETGELVAHFAELDTWPATDPERAPLYLRPAARLEEGRRYVVGIQGLSYVDGSDVEPPAYFAALRDGTELPGTDLEDRRAHYEEVFGVLEDAGVTRGSLLMAWDFVTASGETLWGDLLAMRDDALGDGESGFGRAGERGIGCTVTRVDDATSEDDFPENVYRRVFGMVTVPLYLEGDEPTVEQSRIHRGADGRPEANGTAEVPFTLQIPRSVHDAVAAGGDAAPLEIYGHGLFGSRAELTYGWHRDHQENLGVVSAGVDWWGMSDPDLARVAGTLQSFGDFDATGERLTQAVINFLVLARSLRGVCGELEELQIPLEGGAGTAPSIDPARAYYYGNSQGGIMGGVVAGVSVDLEAFVLGVGGVSYPIMIKRSVNWVNYGAIMAIGYDDPFERDLLMVMSAPLWDLAEPSTYAPHLVRDPLPDTPVKRVLMQVGQGDAQVPPLSAAIQARTAGIPLLTPAPYEPWGLETTAGPVDSALVLYAIPGVERRRPGTNSPGDDNDAHEGVRRSAAAQEQIRRFVAPGGQVEHTCDGVCDPE
ncbi:MAG TPA: hypothetical protein RMH99_28645 [Sandaracinaceae bacterium LLY-WYZ-13_1]|nr:hypothetical protein [Sandaracinaceae bacterium LLY-WYZ-13_1]